MAKQRGDYFAGLWDLHFQGSSDLRSWPSPLDASTPPVRDGNDHSWLDVGPPRETGNDGSGGAPDGYQSWLDLGSPQLQTEDVETSRPAETEVSDAESDEASPSTKRASLSSKPSQSTKRASLSSKPSQSTKRASLSSKRASWLKLVSPRESQHHDVEKQSPKTPPSSEKGAAPKVSGGEKGAPPKPPSYTRRESWPVLLGAFCALFASFGWRSGSGLFQDYYQYNQLRDSSPSSIAWINSTGFFLMYFGALIVSPLNVRYGPRKLLFCGSVLHVGGLLATSFCTTFWQFLLAQGVCSSLGASALFFTSVTTLGRWFQRNQALIIGISASGTSVGGVVFPLMVEHLLPQLGFAWTLRAVVLLIAFLAAIANLTIRVPPLRAGSRPPPPPIKGLKARMAPFKDRTFVLTVLGIALFASGYFAVLTFVVTVARLRGWVDVIDAIVILNGASFFGRILPGLAADRFGRFNTMILLAFLSTVLIFALWIPGNSLRPSIAFSATFGFTSGCTVSLGPSMMFQISEMRTVTWKIALLYGLQSIAALVTSPVGGTLLVNGHGPLYLQVFCGTITGTATVLFVLARLQQTGLHLRKKC